MSRVPTVVMVLGVLVLLLGVVVIAGYSDAQKRANAASESGNFGGLEAVGIWLGWLTNSYRLMILNLFVSGAAIVLAGYGLKSTA